MLQVCSAEEGGLSVADGLHQSFSGLRHLLHLHVIQQTTLLLTGYTWREGGKNVSRVFQQTVSNIDEMLSMDGTTVIHHLSLFTSQCVTYCSESKLQREPAVFE